MVGAMEGAAVMVGEYDGSFVGAADGCVVGLGLNVGSFDGAMEGAVVMVGEYDVVGFVDGDKLGDTVGGGIKHHSGDAASTVVYEAQS